LFLKLIYKLVFVDYASLSSMAYTYVHTNLYSTKILNKSEVLAQGD